MCGAPLMSLVDPSHITRQHKWLPLGVKTGIVVTRQYE
jgi:hypothetical protein